MLYICAKFDGRAPVSPGLMSARKLASIVLALLAATGANAQFTAATGGPFVTGSTPQSMAVADFNLDGKLDIATANFNGNNVSILLGNGSGRFGAVSGPVAVGTNPQSIATADFDGDGNADLVTANAGDQTVTVLLGDGKGGFTAAPAGPTAVGVSPSFIATGDFNGDGKADIVTANSGDNSITVFLGDGTGGFSSVARFLVGSTPVSIGVADFNGDGKLDIVTANSGDNTITVLLGDGNGGFIATGTAFLVGSAPVSIAAGDFNGDGKIDLVTANSGDNTVTVLLGNGTGRFIATPSPFAVGSKPIAVAVGDFNGNGALDIVTANSGDNTVTELLGDGTGGFTAVPSPAAVGTHPSSIAIGDFNGDRKPDLATASLGNDTLTVLLNALPKLIASPSSLTFFSQAGTPARAPLPVTVSSSTSGSTYTASSNQPWLAPAPASHATGGATTVTLSADSTLLTAGIYTGMVRYTAPNYFQAATAVTFNVANPSGGLQAATLSPFLIGASPQSIAVGNFNGDGIPDLVTANSAANNVTVFLSDGSGGFTPAAGNPFLVGVNPYSVVVGDLNGDGNQDIVTANSGDNSVTVLLGDGSGRFAAAAGSPFAAGLKPVSVALGDFNGDGKPDIVLANNSGHNLTVLLGNGTGGFTPAPAIAFPAGLFPQAVAVGDFNGDGNLDIVTAAFNNTVTVLLGLGTGEFTGAATFPVGSFPQSVAVVDFNGDGKPDIVTANSGDNTVTVLLGDGAGGFTQAKDSPFAVGTNPQSVVGVDVNGDGKPDIVTANLNDNTLTVLLGDGTGGFTPASGSPFAVDVTPISVAAADFNADGRTDIATADIDAQTVTVLWGTKAATTSTLNTTAASTIMYGTPVPLTLTVTVPSGGMVVPSGTGVFLDGGSPIGIAAQTGSPYTYTIAGLTVGTHVFTAGYGGDTANASSTSNPVSLTVTLAGQTITFGALANKAFGSAPIVLNATASSGLAVSFTSNTLPVCTVAGANVALLSTGTCTIQADQAGDANFNPAPSVIQTLTVMPGSQTITFGALLAQAFGAPPFDVTATASSGLPVSFASTSLSVCTVAAATVTMLSAGACAIKADQPGDSNYAAAPSVSRTFTVTPTSQTITFGALLAQAMGTAPFAVAATASSGLAVSFTSTTLPVCTVTGTSVTLVSGGTCTIKASQSGNSSYAAATPVSQSFTVTAASQTVTFGALSGKTFGTTPFVVSATASSSLAVTFASTTPAVCTVATASVTLVAVGTCTIEASQAGNASFPAAKPVDQSFTVTPGSQTITFAALASKPMGAAIVLSATASSGLAVSFLSSSLSVCTITGSTPTLVATGTCIIQATQPGNANYAAAPVVSQQFAVTLASQTIAFAAPPNQALGTPSFPLSATASSGLAVSFISTTLPVCTMAGATVTLVSTGTCAIQASQTGNTSYAAASSVSQHFTVTLATQTITFGTLSSQVLGAASFTVSATASSGLAVSFTSTTTTVCTIATATVKLLTAGTCSIQATQTGDSTYGAAIPIVQSFTVAHQDQSITFTALSTQPFGTAPFKVTATASSTLPVTFGSATSTICTVAVATVTLLSVGSCTIQASQAGNSSYGAALSVNQSFDVTPGSQTISFSALIDKPLGTAPFKLTATASSGLAVTFASNSGVCTVSNLTVTLALGGICTIEATQPGNVSYAAATPVDQHFNVTPGGQSITFAALSAQTFGSAPFGVTATASSGLAVGFASMTPTVCSVSSSTVTLLSVGSCSIQASQLGDSNYAAATPVVQSLAVAAGAIAMGSVLNAASYANIPIAPDAYTVAFGINFSTTTAQTPSTTLPATLAGTTVKVTDSKGVTQTAGIFYVSETQINFLVPKGLANGNAVVTIANQAKSVASYPVTIAPVSPSLFSADSSGAGVAAAVALAFAGTASPQVVSVFNCTTSPLACAATPIDLGPASTSVYLELFGTGIRGRTGLPGVSVTLGGVPLKVTYAGAQGTYEGLDQVNALLDRSLIGKGSLTLQLTVDGVAANPVLVSIK